MLSPLHLYPVSAKYRWLLSDGAAGDLPVNPDFLNHCNALLESLLYTKNTGGAHIWRGKRSSGESVLPRRTLPRRLPRCSAVMERHLTFNAREKERGKRMQGGLAGG